MLGIPALTSRFSPRDSNGGQIVLLDQAGLALAMEGLEISKSTASMIEADDEPTGDAGAPTAGTATRISLFQNELVAFLAVIRGNWELQRDGAISAISGAAYSASS